MLLLLLLLLLLLRLLLLLGSPAARPSARHTTEPLRLAEPALLRRLPLPLPLPLPLGSPTAGHSTELLRRLRRLLLLAVNLARHLLTKALRNAK